MCFSRRYRASGVCTNGARMPIARFVKLTHVMARAAFVGIVTSPGMYKKCHPCLRSTFISRHFRDNRATCLRRRNWYKCSSGCIPACGIITAQCRKCLQKIRGNIFDVFDENAIIIMSSVPICLYNGRGHSYLPAGCRVPIVLFNPSLLCKCRVQCFHCAAP